METTDVCLTCEREFEIAKGHVCDGRRPLRFYDDDRSDFEMPERDGCWGRNVETRDLYPSRRRGW